MALSRGKRAWGLVGTLCRGRRCGSTWTYEGVAPKVHEDAFVAPSASVIGRVAIGRGSSIWYTCTLRGDVNHISIGDETNIQDGTVIHVAKNNAKGAELPTIIGNKVTVGHMALLHACTLEDKSFVGMGSIVMDGAVMKEGSLENISDMHVLVEVTHSSSISLRFHVGSWKFADAG